MICRRGVPRLVIVRVGVWVGEVGEQAKGVCVLLQDEEAAKGKRNDRKMRVWRTIFLSFLRIGCRVTRSQFACFCHSMVRRSERASINMQVNVDVDRRFYFWVQPVFLYLSSPKAGKEARDEG